MLTCKLPEGNTGLSTSAAPQVGPSHKRRTSLRWGHGQYSTAKMAGKQHRTSGRARSPHHRYHTLLSGHLEGCAPGVPQATQLCPRALAR